MKKRFGFTLAEVLITLGIIGVVAAMTIPTLIANTNSAKFSSQYKKTLATLNQASLMSQTHYDFDFAGIDANSAANQSPETVTSLAAMLNGTLSGGAYYDSLKSLKYDKNGVSTSYALPTGAGKKQTDLVAGLNAAYRMADGSLLVFKKNKPTGTGCTVSPGIAPEAKITTLKANGCYGYIDVNGPSMPNKEVSCTSGETKADPDAECTVKKGSSANITDIYPVVFHDGTVEPATNAAKTILTSSK